MANFCHECGTATASHTHVVPVAAITREVPKKKAPRKASAYSKQYGKSFQTVQNKYKLKSGKWAKDGFKRAQKAAHTHAKKKMK